MDYSGYMSLRGGIVAVRRVFIVWARPLFYEALRALLESPDIQIVGAGSEHDATESHIHSFQPDTIILEETEDTPITNTDISRLLETSATSLRVVRLSLEDNLLWMYHREQRTLQQPEDLLQLIREE
jgi:DNA-binding NarL/FixJ family response regulator